MNPILAFVLRHGHAVLFAFVFIEQIGAPVPALPMLLAMGALSASGRFSWMTALAVASAAAISGDVLWYGLGRRRGHAVLRLICRISLEPDSCVRRTEDTFGRYGTRTLLFAKFIPGLSTAAPPLAGLSGISLARFLVCDGAGAVLWAAALLGAGYLFSAELERLADVAARLGFGFIVLLALGLAAYIMRKYLQRRKFFRRMRVARITPEELRRKLVAGEDLMIVDLRHPLDAAIDGSAVPGAIRLRPEELEERHAEIPRDRDIILYCT